MLGVGTVVLMASIGLAACGSDGDGTSDSTDPSSSSDVAQTLEVKPTDFATVPPTSTTSPPTSTLPPQPGDTIPTESTYTIVSGDFPSTVASKFKVTLEDLLALNGFELVGQQVPLWPQPGTVIKIPAGATVPNEDGTPGTEVASSDGGGDTTVAPVTTVDVCAASEYEIQAGDAPSTVAAKFDTTIDALAAANADNPNYAAFIVGFKITIPAKTDC